MKNPTIIEAEPQPSTSNQNKPTSTPTKILHEISPVPAIKQSNATKRQKRHATILTSPENINTVRLNAKKKSQRKQAPAKKTRRVRLSSSSNSEDEVEIHYASSDSEDLANECVTGVKNLNK